MVVCGTTEFNKLTLGAPVKVSEAVGGLLLVDGVEVLTDKSICKKNIRVTNRKKCSFYRSNEIQVKIVKVKHAVFLIIQNLLSWCLLTFCVLLLSLLLFSKNASLLLSLWHWAKKSSSSLALSLFSVFSW